MKLLFCFFASVFLFGATAARADAILINDFEATDSRVYDGNSGDAFLANGADGRFLFGSASGDQSVEVSATGGVDDSACLIDPVGGSGNGNKVVRSRQLEDPRLKTDFSMFIYVEDNTSQQAGSVGLGWTLNDVTSGDGSSFLDSNTEAGRFIVGLRHINGNTRTYNWGVWGNQYDSYYNSGQSNFTLDANKWYRLSGSMQLDGVDTWYLSGFKVDDFGSDGIGSPTTVASLPDVVVTPPANGYAATLQLTSEAHTTFIASSSRGFPRVDELAACLNNGSRTSMVLELAAGASSTTPYAPAMEISKVGGIGQVGTTAGGVSLDGNLAGASGSISIQVEATDSEHGSQDAWDIDSGSNITINTYSNLASSGSGWGAVSGAIGPNYGGQMVALTFDLSAFTVAQGMQLKMTGFTTIDNNSSQPAEPNFIVEGSSSVNVGTGESYRVDVVLPAGGSQRIAWTGSGANYSYRLKNIRLELVPTTTSTAVRPNVLFIAIDDLVPALGCYGDPTMIANNGTPEIDSLAAQGMTFFNHFVHAPICGASRASMTTGLLPDETGVTFFQPIRGAEFLPDVITLPQHFKNNGYGTAGTGKIHDYRTVGDTTQPLGADGRYPSGGTRDDPASWSIPYSLAGGNAFSLLGKPLHDASDRPDSDYGAYNKRVEGINLINQLVNQQRPFFCAVGFFLPHMPWIAPKSAWDIHDTNGNGDYTDDMPLPAITSDPVGASDSMIYALDYSGEFLSYDGYDDANPPTTDADFREIRHAYYASVSFIDKQVGALLDHLAATDDPLQSGKKLSETTIVVLWSDHGFAIGEHSRWGKHVTQERSVWAPLIILDPSQPGNGAKTQALASNLDIYPTLCELAGLPIPTQPLSNVVTSGRSMRGRSLVPVLQDPSAQVNPAIISRNLINHIDSNNGYSIRSENYRLIEWISNSGTVTARDLYRYDGDRVERINLADNAEYEAVVSQLSTAIRLDPVGQLIPDLANSSPASAPVDPSIPEISISIEGGEASINWPALANSSSRVMSTTDLAVGFTELANSQQSGSLTLSADKSQEFFMVEAETNLPPQFEQAILLGFDAEVGSALAASLAGWAEDPEASAITWTKLSGPAWLSVAANGALSGTPASTDVGVNFFQVQASDVPGSTSTALMEIKVE